MSDLILHHVSYPVHDVRKAAAFYCELFGLTELPRPEFGIDGAWLACGDREIHLVENRESGTYRTGKPIDPADVHFAFRTGDFDGLLERLQARGYSADLPKSDDRFLLVMRDSAAGFAQLYLKDPDGHTIEVNAAPLRSA